MLHHVIANIAFPFTYDLLEVLVKYLFIENIVNEKRIICSSRRDIGITSHIMATTCYTISIWKLKEPFELCPGMVAYEERSFEVFTFLTGH